MCTKNFDPILTGILTLAFSIIATDASAQGVLIDQSLQPPPNTGGSYHYDSSGWTLIPGTGQEFTPSLTGLDFVDVNLFGNSLTNTGTFQIAIHAGNITAPVLGLSDEVSSSTGGFPNNDAHFTFSSTVALTAGDIYVLELLQVGGTSGWEIEVPISAVVNGQPVDMNYPGGRLIYGAVPQDNNDMIFAEGIVVPEPAAVPLCLLGFLTFRFMRRLQKINTIQIDGG